MLFLLDTHDPEKARLEMKVSIGQLITPLTRRYNQKMAFGIDNGAFAKFNAASFRMILEREQDNRSKCLFVAAPDVVGDARRTLECLDHWYPALHGWPIALVAQDGAENLPIPWAIIKAIFIGGSTEWKMGAHAAAIIKAAKIMEKYVHVGRVNTALRYEYFEDLGVNSCDGTGVSRFSHMRSEIGGESLLSGIKEKAGVKGE